MHHPTLYRRLFYCRTLAYQIRYNLELLLAITADPEPLSTKNETYLLAWKANNQTIANLDALIEKNARPNSTTKPETEP